MDVAETCQYIVDEATETNLINRFDTAVEAQLEVLTNPLATGDPGGLQQINAEYSELMSQAAEKSADSAMSEALIFTKDQTEQYIALMLDENLSTYELQNKAGALSTTAEAQKNSAYLASACPDLGQPG